MTVLPDNSPPPVSTADAEECDVTVVGGAGHVGVPLVLAMAEAGFRVNVNDTSRARIDMLRAGCPPFIEYGAEAALKKALRERRLAFTLSPQGISRGGPVVITIGTPIDEYFNPVRKVVQDCIDDVLPFLADGQLLVLRSTLFPGTIDWLASYLQSKGRDLLVAYCPERIVQGAGLKELYELPQIISGTTPEAERAVAELFGRFAPELVAVSPIEAEFAKLFSNSYRYIEFAMTNEFYLITKSAGVDYQHVLQAMKLHYPRLSGIPRPGFAAGPCLLKDTMQLAAFSRNQFALGHAALLINEGLVLHVVEDLKRRYDLAQSTVGLLGMAFKAESDDTRDSLSYKFKKVLSVQTRAVLTTDPFVTTDLELRPLDDVIARSDIMILCAPHATYRAANFHDKPVFDLWGHLDGNNVIR